MKNRFLKKMMVPFAILFIGIAGAFVTTSMSSAPMGDEKPGYRYLSQQVPCFDEEQQCTTEFQLIVCTSGSHDLYAKPAPTANVCDIPLYKIPN